MNVNCETVVQNHASINASKEISKHSENKTDDGNYNNDNVQYGEQDGYQKPNQYPYQYKQIKSHNALHRHRSTINNCIKKSQKRNSYQKYNQSSYGFNQNDHYINKNGQSKPDKIDVFDAKNQNVSTGRNQTLNDSYSLS